jgi:hypothetical protein
VSQASKEVLHLKSVVDDLESQLAKARGRLHAAICAEHPFQPGAVVLVRDGHRSYVARVQSLGVRWGRVEMEVGKRLKSGEFSTFGTTVRSYMTAEPYVEAAE